MQKELPKMLNELIPWLPWIIGGWAALCAGAWLVDEVLPRHPKLQKLLDKLFGIEEGGS